MKSIGRTFSVTYKKMFASKSWRVTGGAKNWLIRRSTHTFGAVKGGKSQPLGASEIAWPGGIASFMRLPVQKDTKGLDVCFVGVPLDVGTTNRSGTRYGPRQIRFESMGIRPVNGYTDDMPFDRLNVADIGDVGFTMYDLPIALTQIREGYEKIMENEVVPLTLGGDHTITYPIMQAMAKKHGPMAVVHINAHADTADSVWGSKGMHATTFRRAVEEKLVDPNHFYQIGLRGSGYEKQHYKWGQEQGFTIVRAEECWHKSMNPLMEKIRKEFGKHRPVYISFDIDGIDPGFCPGTGTREIGGLTPPQAIEILRGCKGLNIVGGDMVEVSPAYDQQGSTAHLAANLLFEMLCSLPSK